MAKKPTMETQRGRKKARGLAYLANITVTAARQSLDHEQVLGSGTRTAINRDRWLFRRGVMP